MNGSATFSLTLLMGLMIVGCGGRIEEAEIEEASAIESEEATISDETTVSEAPAPETTAAEEPTAETDTVTTTSESGPNVIAEPQTGCSSVCPAGFAYVEMRASSCVTNTEGQVICPVVGLYNRQTLTEVARWTVRPGTLKRYCACYDYVPFGLIDVRVKSISFPPSSPMLNVNVNSAGVKRQAGASVRSSGMTANVYKYRVSGTTAGECGSGYALLSMMYSRCKTTTNPFQFVDFGGRKEIW
jgi:hypothetical protein